jgi:hypothetical protein
MDDARFDALARSLGRLGPRRGALKAIAALATGGLTLRLAVRPVAAIACEDVGDCPEPPCQFVECKRRKCVFTQNPECCTEDADCDDGDPCTSETCDTELFRCQRTPQPEGSPCGADTSCRNGRCRCARVQEPCRGTRFNNDCCSVQSVGLSCVPSPLGDTRCCRENLRACNHNSDCCSGACRNDHCCDPAAGQCDRDGECCGSAVCRDNTCCVPAPKSTTCQGRCGQVLNNCGRNVDCGCCGLGEVCSANAPCCQQEQTECVFNIGGSQPTCCRLSGYGCRQDGDCCGGGICRGGSRKTCCQPPQETCHQSGDCCGAAVCRNGLCCEDRAGAFCDADDDCCGARFCFVVGNQGTCT